MAEESSRCLFTSLSFSSESWFQYDCTLPWEDFYYISKAEISYFSKPKCFFWARLVLSYILFSHWQQVLSDSTHPQTNSITLSVYKPGAKINFTHWSKFGIKLLQCSQHSCEVFTVFLQAASSRVRITVSQKVPAVFPREWLLTVIHPTVFQWWLLILYTH
jgi:hypothetical protein